jgi:mannan endo-1,4-beta-mannosidase
MNYKIFLFCLLSLNLFSCKDKEEIGGGDKKQPLTCVSSNPANGATDVSAITTSAIVLTYDRDIMIATPHDITLNGQAVTGKVTVSARELIIPVILREETDYKLTVPASTVIASKEVLSAPEVTISFHTTKGEKSVTLVSSNPVNGATDVSAITTSEIVLAYDQTITLIPSHNITFNEQVVTAKITVSGQTLKIPVTLEEKTEYQLTVPAGNIFDSEGIFPAPEINLTFRTKEETLMNFAPLVVTNPSPEALNLYNFLKENYGKKIISGTVDNVNWNTNEADWVYKHTGKYPALNGFDYIHLYANWMDYTNTTVVENWWKNNGIVAAIWHWNVPKSKESNEYAFYSNETSFDIREAVKDGTYENGIVKADLQKIADRLLLLKNKNIPVLWRPLHEAAGGWFWWGAKGPEPCKALWKMMFNYFEERGLNNLIWIWTAEPKDIVGGNNAWYPGDEYVDIIGRDIYNQTTANGMYSEYNTLTNRYPNKIITLSEFGNVAGVTEQLNANATWSWFMSWYDYNRTNNPSSTAFDSKDHEHANITYWTNAFANDKVISRAQMPNLK